MEVQERLHTAVLLAAKLSVFIEVAYKCFVGCGFKHMRGCIPTFCWLRSLVLHTDLLLAVEFKCMRGCIQTFCWLWSLSV